MSSDMLLVGKSQVVPLLSSTTFHVELRNMGDLTDSPAVVERVNNGEDLDKLDKLAESSSQAVSRRLSSSNNVNPLRKSNISIGNDKGKNRMHDGVENEDSYAQYGSEVESLYDSDDESLHCAICLSVIDDRTVVQPCCHGRQRRHKAVGR